MSDDAKYQITPEAYEALSAELHELETEGRNQIAERIRIAREWGDLKENAEYHDAKNSQAHLETKIQRLRDLHRNAIIVEPTQGADTVGLGSTVVVRDEDAGSEKTYVFVTAQEADPVAGKLSIDSPLAHALAGAKVDEVRDFQAPRGAKRLRVVGLS
jgi:transcription elongation factor GreA